MISKCLQILDLQIRTIYPHSRSEQFYKQNIIVLNLSYVLGFIALVWVAVLKYYAMNLTGKKRTIVGMSSNGNLLSHNSSNMDQVPWLTYLKSPALW